MYVELLSDSSAAVDLLRSESWLTYPFRKLITFQNLTERNAEVFTETKSLAILMKFLNYFILFPVIVTHYSHY